MKSALEHDHRQRKGRARQALAVSAVACAERERLVSEAIANEAAQAASVIWCRHQAALQKYPSVMEHDSSETDSIPLAQRRSRGRRRTTPRGDRHGHRGAVRPCRWL